MNSYRFDLEKAVAAWRRPFEHHRAFSSEDLEELESSLRDRVEALVDSGLSEEAAFREAVRRTGSYGTAEMEYRKVYWGKLRRRRQLAPELIWRISMLKNYLKIAFRNLRRQKGYAFINIFGLAVGLAFCTLIFLYVRDERTFDRFHTQQDRIYRAYKTTYKPDGSIEDREAWLPVPLGPAMKADVPEVEEYVRLRTRGSIVQVGTVTLEEAILFADASIFDVFTFPLLKGSPQTALADPWSVVLTESMASKYFGAEEPMGRRLAIRLTDRFEDFVVTGVAKDIPGNSSIRFNLLAPFSKLMSLNPGAADNWGDSSYSIYVKLRENTSSANVDKKLVSIRAKYFPNEVQRLREQGHWSGDGLPLRYHLQPLSDIHLNTGIRGDPPPSNPRYSYILGSIALGVLAIACINFMMLAIGRSAGRAREIGVRKVVGALRRQLMLQFCSEALILSVAAMAAGLGLARLFLPVFNELADKTLRIADAGNVGALLVLVGLVFVTALLAGGYPALVLSSLRPVETLKNSFKLGGSHVLMRSLVVVQFTLSVFLLVCTLIMIYQLRYVRTMDLGFDKEQVVVIPVKGLDGQRTLRLFQDELGRRSDIAGVTGINNTFARGTWGWGFRHKGEQKAVFVYRAESNFLDVLGMELVAGRNFDPDQATDSTHAVIINEAMARDFGWTDPVGQIVSGMYEEEPSRDPTVIGVMKDFNFLSLRQNVKPMMLSLSMDKIYYMLARIRPGSMPAALAALRATWSNVAPDLPFTYSLLDDDLDRQYRAEDRWSRIVGYGSFFAILVACLGLFGLAALTVAGRTKEIGIRKVLGASVSSIAGLISRKFAWLVIVALALATPTAYVAMSRWLEDFAYRIELGPGVFLLSGALALGIALLTVSYHSIRVALADPVKSLRYE